MATVREIADLAGVSPSTVSRVINGNVPVTESTRNKVLGAMRRLDGQGNMQKMLNSGRNVGIIMPIASAVNLAQHPSLYTTVISFIETLSEHNISNTTIVLDKKPQYDYLRVNPMSAYLILGTSEEEEEKLVPLLSKMSAPFLFINRQIENKYASCISIDDEQATETAVNYILSLGHRNIAFIGGNQNYKNTKLRYLSFVRALEKAGIKPDNDLVLYGEYSEISGYEMGERLISTNKIPTAACVASDPIAIGFMRCLNDHNIKVPEDISVVGFGNIEASAYVSPSLTTISQNSFEMGKVAALAMIQMLESSAILRQQILLRTELVIRNSCAAISK